MEVQPKTLMFDTRQGETKALGDHPEEAYLVDGEAKAESLAAPTETQVSQAGETVTGTDGSWTTGSSSYETSTWEESTTTASSGPLPETPLDLSGCGLPRTDLLHFCESLERDGVVTKLDISGNMFMENPRRRIERAEPRCLLPCVKEPKDFEKADYAICDAFANAIRKNRAVRTLNISKTNMGAMGQKGIVNIIRALQERDKLVNLLSLDLSEVLLLGESRMRYNGISALADFLRECVGLKTLILRRNHLHTEAVKFVADGLCRNKTLTHLDLSENQISRSPQGRLTVTGVQAFSSWFQTSCRLDTLNLSSNELGNEEAIQLGYDLCHMFSLRTLVLAHNNIKTLGAAALARALPMNESLTELTLSHNRCYDDGALALLRGLAHNTALLTLRLAHTNVTHCAADSIEACLRKNHGLRTLDLNGNALFPHNLKAFELHTGLNTDIVDLITRADPESFNFKERSAAYKRALFEKMDLLPSQVLMALRDGNKAMMADRIFAEYIVDKCPYTRKQALALEQERKAMRREMGRTRMRAVKAFIGNKIRADARRKVLPPLAASDSDSQTTSVGTDSQGTAEEKEAERSAAEAAQPTEQAGLGVDDVSVVQQEVNELHSLIGLHVREELAEGLGSEVMSIAASEAISEVTL